MARSKPIVDDRKLRKEFLKKAQETLQETKKQLLREIRGRVKEETEGSKDEGRDTYDLASDERDREINFILNDREREKLLGIDEALQRGVRDAVLRHKRDGLPMVIYRDGKTVWVKPEDLSL